MNRIKEAFETKTQGLLSIYFTAGFPELNSTVGIITALAESKVDMIEIGIPFSDPMADGTVIQHSNEKALQNGMTLALLFEQLKDIRQHTSVPLVLMGYLNPIMQFGIKGFLTSAKTCGIDGVIIPDLPIAEYEDHYKEMFEQYALGMIFLITPHTSPERIRKIDELAKGFIYMVTTAATTGGSNDFTDSQFDYFQSVKSMHLSNPIVAGFGIHNKAVFDLVCSYADGAIIGSGFIKAINGRLDNLTIAIREFIKTIRS